MVRFFYGVEFHPLYDYNTARQKKTSTHRDGNTTRNQQTSSHNDKTSPHHNVATVHFTKTPKHQDKTSKPKEQRLDKKVMAFHR